MNIGNMSQRLGTLAAMVAAAAACVIGTPAHASDADMNAAAASTRSYWDKVVGQAYESRGGMILPKAATPPVINSIMISSNNIGASTVPHPARFYLNLSSQAGVSTIMFDIRARDYSQGYRRQITMPYPHKTGTFVFDSATISSFNKPGYWDLRFIGVCDVLGQCTQQDFYSQPASADRQFNVINNRTPDVTKPQVTSATLATTTLTTHSTGVANVFLKLGLSDTGGMGAIGASVCARNPDESEEVCGYWDLPGAVFSGNQTVTIPFVGNTHFAGTWHIAVVEITDYAGNNLFINGPTDLDAMFPNGRTFTLTNGS